MSLSSLLRHRSFFLHPLTRHSTPALLSLPSLRHFSGVKDHLSFLCHRRLFFDAFKVLRRMGADRPSFVLPAPHALALLWISVEYNPFSAMNALVDVSRRMLQDEPVSVHMVNLVLRGFCMTHHPKALRKQTNKERDTIDEMMRMSSGEGEERGPPTSLWKEAQVLVDLLNKANKRPNYLTHLLLAHIAFMVGENGLREAGLTQLRSCKVLLKLEPISMSIYDSPEYEFARDGPHPSAIVDMPICKKLFLSASEARDVEACETIQYHMLNSGMKLSPWMINSLYRFKKMNIPLKEMNISNEEKMQLIKAKEAKRRKKEAAFIEEKAKAALMPQAKHESTFSLPQTKVRAAVPPHSSSSSPLSYGHDFIIRSSSFATASFEELISAPSVDDLMRLGVQEDVAGLQTRYRSLKTETLTEWSQQKPARFEMNVDGYSHMFLKLLLEPSPSSTIDFSLLVQALEEMNYFGFQLPPAVAALLLHQLSIYPSTSASRLLTSSNHNRFPVSYLSLAKHCHLLYRSCQAYYSTRKKLSSVLFELFVRSQVKDRATGDMLSSSLYEPSLPPSSSAEASILASQEPEAFDMDNANICNSYDANRFSFVEPLKSLHAFTINTMTCLIYHEVFSPKHSLGKAYHLFANISLTSPSTISDYGSSPPSSVYYLLCVGELLRQNEAKADKIYQLALSKFKELPFHFHEAMFQGHSPPIENVDENARKAGISLRLELLKLYENLQDQEDITFTLLFLQRLCSFALELQEDYFRQLATDSAICEYRPLAKISKFVLDRFIRLLRNGMAEFEAAASLMQILAILVPDLHFGRWQIAFDLLFSNTSMATYAKTSAITRFLVFEVRIFELVRKYNPDIVGHLGSDAVENRVQLCPSRVHTMDEIASSCFRCALYSSLLLFKSSMSKAVTVCSFWGTYTNLAWDAPVMKCLLRNFINSGASVGHSILRSNALMVSFLLQIQSPLMLTEQKHRGLSILSQAEHLELNRHLTLLALITSASEASEAALEPFICDKFDMGMYSSNRKIPIDDGAAALDSDSLSLLAMVRHFLNLSVALHDTVDVSADRIMSCNRDVHAFISLAGRIRASFWLRILIEDMSRFSELSGLDVASFIEHITFTCETAKLPVALEAALKAFRLVQGRSDETDEEEDLQYRLFHSSARFLVRSGIHKYTLQFFNDSLLHIKQDGHCYFLLMLKVSIMKNMPDAFRSTIEAFAAWDGTVSGNISRGLNRHSVILPMDTYQATISLEQIVALLIKDCSWMRTSEASNSKEKFESWIHIAPWFDVNVPFSFKEDVWFDLINYLPLHSAFTSVLRTYELMFSSPRILDGDNLNIILTLLHDLYEVHVGATTSTLQKRPCPRHPPAKSFLDKQNTKFKKMQIKKADVVTLVVDLPTYIEGLITIFARYALLHLHVMCIDRARGLLPTQMLFSYGDTHPLRVKMQQHLWAQNTPTTQSDILKNRGTLLQRIAIGDSKPAKSGTIHEASQSE